LKIDSLEQNLLHNSLNVKYFGFNLVPAPTLHLTGQGREIDDKSRSFKTAQNIFDSKSFASNCQWRPV
jgi:hypothetical protein